MQGHCTMYLQYMSWWSHILYTYTYACTYMCIMHTYNSGNIVECCAHVWLCEFYQGTKVHWPPHPTLPDFLAAAPTASLSYFCRNDCHFPKVIVPVRVRFEPDGEGWADTNCPRAGNSFQWGEQGVLENRGLGKKGAGS